MNLLRNLWMVLVDGKQLRDSHAHGEREHGTRYFLHPSPLVQDYAVASGVGVLKKKEFACILISRSITSWRSIMERELWLQLYRIVVSLDRFDWRGRYRASDILLVFLWAVVHDRPTVWACQPKNWSTPPRHLPTQPTMSRRLRSPLVQQLLSAVEEKLGGDAQGWWVCRIDSKPLVVGCYSKDRGTNGGVRASVMHAVTSSTSFWGLAHCRCVGVLLR